MLRRIGFLIFAVLLMANLCSCALLVAGAAGGAGTAAWLSGKLTQEVNVPRDRAVSASKKAMSSMKLPVTKETTQEDVVQIIGEYSDGRQVWIDVRTLTEKTSRIEVRVGAMGDELAADKILTKIKRYL